MKHYKQQKIKPAINGTNKNVNFGWNKLEMDKLIWKLVCVCLYDLWFVIDGWMRNVGLVSIIYR